MHLSFMMATSKEGQVHIMLYHRIIDNQDREAVRELELFVTNHFNSHFLQTPRWGEVKECWQWQGILVYRQAKLVGAMSVLVRKLSMGMSILYAPRGPVCDRKDGEILAELLTAAGELAQLRGALLLFLDPDEPDENDLFRQRLANAGFSERHSEGFGNIQAQYVMRLPLKGRSEEDVFEGFPAKTRYSIRTALRKGVQLRRFYGNEEIPEEVLDAFTQLNQVTGRRDKFIPRGKEYFRKILKTFGKDAVLYMACLQGRAIAGTIGMYTGGKAWYLYGASSNDRRETMPNYLLQWEMIRHAIGLGCVFYDLRGVPGTVSEDHPLHGLYRFKKRFTGSEPVKFTGLFMKAYRPMLARCFLLAWKLRGKLHKLRLAVR